MTSTPRTTLAIGFSDDVTKVRFRAAENYERALHKFSLKFRTAVQRSPAVFDAEIDELLLNLIAIAEWPAADGVVWDEDLAALVKDMTTDAEIAGKRLQNPEEATDSVGPDDISELLGPDWTGDLTNFQRRDIARLLSLQHGANFSVPGAGKTRVGLAVFQALRNLRSLDRILIVAPKSAHESWLFENAECIARPLRMEVHSDSVDPSAQALIINYERLDRNVNELSVWLAARPSMLLLDEAHRMKRGPGGVYGSACLALGPRARTRMILTGTPAPNGAKDLENLFGFTWPGYGRQKVSQAIAGGDLAYASRALKPLFVRTTKGELGLPPVTSTVRPITLPPLHREIYDALIGQYSVRASATTAEFDALGKVVAYLLMAATSPALLTVGTTKYDPLSFQVPPLPVSERSPLFDLMRDLPSYEMSPKYREVLALIKANASAGRKTIVWSTFIRSLMTLERMLEPYSPAIVHGGTNDREIQLRRFRSDSDCMVLLSNPATLGEGISLHQVCNDAVYVDRDFAAGRYLQSQDRIHRLGLSHDTITRITVLVSAGTIDEVVEQRLRDKLTFMGEILDDPAVRELADLEEEPSIAGLLDRDDLAALTEHLRGHPA